MLQRLLLITLTLCSLSASAQWQQTGSKVRYVNGLGIPTKDTAAGVSADSSQILIRPADSSLYVKYKRTWIKVGGSTVSGTINRLAKFTGATTLGNSSIVDSASAVAMTINASGNVGIGTTNPRTKLDIAGNLFVNNESNITFPETSTTSYANMFRQSSTAALVLANGYKYSPTAGGFASSFTTTERTAIQVGGGNISFFTDPSSTVAVGTDITPSERLSIINSGNIGVGYTSPAAKLAVNGTTLINTNTDNGVDKLQVSGSMNVSAGAKAQSLSVTNNIDQGSGTADTYWTVLAKSSSSGWAGQMRGNTTTGQFEFYHRNNSPTYSLCFAINANSAKGNTTFYDNAFIGGDGWLTVNGSTNNGVDKLQVVGSTISTQYKLSALNTAPATASSTGTLGEIRIDANYIYICTATNTWKRVAIATW
jgi:hypothetical protein